MEIRSWGYVAEILLTRPERKESAKPLRVATVVLRSSIVETGKCRTFRTSFLAQEHAVKYSDRRHHHPTEGWGGWIVKLFSLSVLTHYPRSRFSFRSPHLFIFFPNTFPNTGFSHPPATLPLFSAHVCPPGYSCNVGLKSRMRARPSERLLHPASNQAPAWFNPTINGMLSSTQAVPRIDVRFDIQY